MKIGFGAPVSGVWASPDNLQYFTTRAEDLNYHSIWTFQRLLVPAHTESAPVYRSVLDPLISLAYVAARTSRIRLGVAVVNAPYVSPAYLAKQAATLDLISGGRLDLGIGLGWSAEEFVASGVPMELRAARVREHLAALRTLWGDETSEFLGEFYTLPPSHALPRPAQRPYPQILLGGGVPVALRRAGRLADGWISRSAADLTRIAKDIALVREGAAAAGKDPSAVRAVIRGVVRPGESMLGPDGERLRLSGSYDQIRDDVAWLEEQGATEIFYDLNFNPRVGNPDVDPIQARDLAEEVLTALAP
jgi:probable F420-dependent oxidoreductase